MTITHFDQSTILAHRAQTAATITVEEPTLFALPGAFAAISKDRLEAHQALGRDQHEIVKRENVRHIAAHPEIEAARAEWITGQYDAVVKAFREFEDERIRAEQERRSRFNQRVAEIRAQQQEAQDAETA